MDKTMEEAWTRKDDQGDPRKAWESSGWGCNKLEMPLASPADKV